MCYIFFSFKTPGYCILKCIAYNTSCHCFVPFFFNSAEINFQKYKCVNNCVSVDTALAKSALSPHGGKTVKLLNTLQEEQDRREKKPLLRRDTEEVSVLGPLFLAF